MFRALIFALLMLLNAPPAVPRDLDAAFRAWLERDFWPRAQRAGISRPVFDSALSGLRLNLKLPDLRLPGQGAVEREQKQAEFAAPAKYFNQRALRIHAARGRALWRKHRDLLRQIEKRFGVPGPIVLAIWARESNYGRARIPHDAFAILATQAFLSRRKALFRAELLAALRILQRRLAPRSGLKSSWAGALGQPQMMPGDYLAYAVDFDGDGRRDIWRSVPDVLASIANHLHKHGWRRGLAWGVEVKVPAAVSCALEGPDQGRPLKDWRAMGLRPVRGAFPPSMRRGKVYLLMPAGRFGPAFLVTGNFYVIKDYNMSDLYALFVGHLGDRIHAGGRAFSRPFADVGHLRRIDVARMQRALVRAGHDVGG
ncbi:MAG TPA: lytic murein transglycosylase, partial [Thermopetrobacter sp.]|nr:lytic murein transglycosylase [Thermopetrobacter sp.]